MCCYPSLTTEHNKHNLEFIQNKYNQFNLISLHVRRSYFPVKSIDREIHAMYYKLIFTNKIFEKKLEKIFVIGEKN